MGTLIAMMPPCSIFFMLTWSGFFFAWTFLMNLPVAPGSPTFYPSG